MKKFICFICAMFLVANAYGGSTKLGTETILNNVYDSTNTALKAKVSGVLSAVTDISSDTGVITFAGTGNTNNENLSMDFETTANTVTLGTTSGVNDFSFGTLGLLVSDNEYIYFGNSFDSGLNWETTGNDNLQLGLKTNNASYSGYFTIVSYADLGIANRSPSGTSVDPVLRVYSGDGTAATDYIEMYHDQTDGNINVGDGDLHFDIPKEMDIDLGWGRIVGIQNGTAMFDIRYATDTDELKLGLDDNCGNQFIVTNYSNSGSDHDHALQTHPTLFVHADTDPDSDNTKWVSVSHISQNALIASGSGGIVQTVPLSQPSIGVAQRMSFYLDEGTNKLMITIVSPDNVTYTSTLDLT